MVAGRAAHAGTREESALSFYRQAEEAADSPRHRRDALFGQLMCASALELDEVHELLRLLESSATRSDPYELVRMADKNLGVDYRLGTIRHLGHARQVSELVSDLADPFVRCSFRGNFSYGLSLSAFYDEAREQAERFLDDAQEFRVDPALPYAHMMHALSLVGLGRHQDAHLALDVAIRESRRCNDEFGVQCVYACRVRLLVQEGRALEACTMEPPDLEVSLRSVRGEVLGSRGLALASLGRPREARALAAEAIGVTTGVEARVLAAAIDAVCAVNGREAGMMDSVERLVDMAFDAGAVDFVVTAYRGNADLLSALLSSSIARERAIYIVARAGDESLVNAIGREIASSADPVETLSRREREVYELVCEGLSNGEIAHRLFISEGTVKVHVHHVFDKLGIRSRTALAMNAARDRWRQAASTASSDDDGSGAIASSPTPSRSASST
jgi:DNA-binding CsgD family transcriptional regulator/tetratricopeptide (TPR) repeat protein